MVAILIIGNGTEATDACLRSSQDHTICTVDVVSECYTSTGADFITIIPPIMEPPPIIITYPYPDSEGVFWKKECHKTQFKIRDKAHFDAAFLARRLQKRPYSGQHNLRFRRTK